MPTLCDTVTTGGDTADPITADRSREEEIRVQGSHGEYQDGTGTGSVGL